MRTLGLTILLLLGLNLSVGAAPGQTVTVEKLPGTVEEFLALRKKLASTPEGGAALFVVSMLVYEKDRGLGMSCFTIAMDRSRLIEDAKGYKGFAPGRGLTDHLTRLRGRLPYPKSYVQGTTPEGGYKTKAPFKFLFTRNRYSALPNGDIKVFVDCSGAATPRPMTLRKNDRGIWKAVEFSSMFVGVKKPSKKIDDDL